MSAEPCPICKMPVWLRDTLGPCEHTPEEWAAHVRSAFRETLAKLFAHPTGEASGDE